MAADKERRKQKPQKKEKKNKNKPQLRTRKRKWKWNKTHHENVQNGHMADKEWDRESEREREGEMNAGKGNWNEHSTHTHTHTDAEKIAVKKPKQTPNVIDRKMLQFAHLRQEHQNQTSKPANQQTKPALRAAIRAATLAYEYQNYSSAECRVPYTTDTTSISLNAAHYLY